MSDGPRDCGGYPIRSLSDPESLLDADAVPVESVTRGLNPEPFEARRERYAGIDGVVQIGLVDGDGQVLLQGWDGASAWAPPGGTVNPGQDWVEAAREDTERLTGVAVSVDRAVLVEDLTFRETASGASFSAYGVSFLASLDDDAEAFRADPTVADGSRFADRDVALDWFSAVPDDTNENHVDHVEMFLRTA